MDDAAAVWTILDPLVADAALIVDRPRGSRHRRFPEPVCPLGHGYPGATGAGDGGNIDLWRAAVPATCVDSVIVTVDGMKRDREIELMSGCTEAEIAKVLAVHNAAHR